MSIRNSSRVLRFSILPIVCLLGACDGGGGDDPVLGSLPAEDSPAGLTLYHQQIQSPTASASTVVRGKSAQAGSSIEIYGGLEQAGATLPAETQEFAVPVMLGLNKVNKLYVTEFFSDGTTGVTVPLQVVQDSSAPEIWIDFPQSGSQLSEASLTIVGRVSDKLSGYLGLSVSVNGVPAEVDQGIGTNGTFEVSGLLIPAVGPLTIQAVAADAVGNVGTTSVDVTFVLPDGFVVSKGQGDDQVAPVESVLSQPVQVSVKCPDGSPMVGKLVEFRIVKSNGKLSTIAELFGDEQCLSVFTDDNGLAEVYWMLGSDAGCGNNRILVTSEDVDGNVYFCASATPLEADQINVGSGASQVVAAGSPTPEPLRCWVSDGCNGSAGIPVVFSIIAGTGATIRDEVTGTNSDPGGALVVTTDETGHAEVSLYSGDGIGLYEVEADFEGNPGLPARFVVRVPPAGENGETRLEGVVLDNAESPIGGATAILHVGELVLEQSTDEQGVFRFEDLQISGPAELEVLGQTATLVGGAPLESGTRYPELHYEILLCEGCVNSLPAPVRLPVLETANDREYTGAQDVELSLAGVEGLRFRIEAGSALLPAGTPLKGGGTLAEATLPTPDDPLPIPALLSVNQVHHADIPMPMPDGVAPAFAWTMQPGGMLIDPPATITYPNMTGLDPGSASYFLSFDHATGRFEIVASGQVSDDGAIIVSDPGTGITISGWGCNCPPYASVADCDNCFSLCLENGQLSGGQVEGGAAKPYVGDLLSWVASGVQDSGGSKQVICPDGSSTIVQIPPGPLVYQWTVSGPNGNKGGSGPGALVLPEQYGCYDVSFTVEAARDCAPTPLPLFAGTVSVCSDISVFGTGNSLKLNECPESDRVNPPGYIATTNGCTLSPDNPNIGLCGVFGPSFVDACNTHDLGYGECGRAKELTDTQFEKELLQACDDYDFESDFCDSALSYEFACISNANLYATAVNLVGNPAYLAAQADACECCASCGGRQ